MIAERKFLHIYIYAKVKPWHMHTNIEGYIIYLEHWNRLSKICFLQSIVQSTE